MLSLLDLTPSQLNWKIYLSGYKLIHQHTFEGINGPFSFFALHIPTKEKLEFFFW